MSTFFQKLRVVTLGAANDLLSKAIDMNSPSALRQYVRDLEEAISKLQDEAANQAGQVRTTERELAILTAKISADKTLIQSNLASATPNAALARAKAGEVVQFSKELADDQAKLVAQRQTSANLDAAVAQLNNKHSLMLSRVRELERLDRDSKGKEQAAKAISAAGSLVDGGTDISVDDLESKIRARNDVASVKLERALGSTTTAEDPSTTADIDNLLSELAPASAAAHQ